MIKVPMDQELYDAAVGVMDEIERKLAHASRHREGRLLSDEEILGRDLAQAYRRWQTLLICRYTESDTSPPKISAAEEPRLDGRRHNRPATPKKNHPWRGRAKLAKT